MSKEPPTDLTDLANQIERIIVDEDDVVEAITHREKPEPLQQSKKVIRINPPFRGSVEGSIYSELSGNRYPDEITEPIHLSPYAFLVDRDIGVYPTRSRVRDIAASDRGIDLDDVSEDVLAQERETWMNVFQGQIRSKLADEIGPSFELGPMVRALSGTPVKYK